MKFPFLPQPFYRESLFPRRRYIPRRTELRIPPFHGYNEHRESSYVHTITFTRVFPLSGRRAGTVTRWKCTFAISLNGLKFTLLAFIANPYYSTGIDTVSLRYVYIVYVYIFNSVFPRNFRGSNGRPISPYSPKWLFQKIEKKKILLLRVSISKTCCALRETADRCVQYRSFNDKKKRERKRKGQRGNWREFWFSS